MVCHGGGVGGGQPSVSSRHADKATGKWFVIPLCQRARVLDQTVY